MQLSAFPRLLTPDASTENLQYQVTLTYALVARFGSLSDLRLGTDILTIVLCPKP